MKKVLIVLFIVFGLVSPLLIIVDARRDVSHSFVKRKILEIAVRRKIVSLQKVFLQLSAERKEMVIDILSVSDEKVFERLAEWEIAMEEKEEDIKKVFRRKTLKHHQRR